MTPSNESPSENSPTANDSLGLATISPVEEVSPDEPDLSAVATLSDSPYPPSGEPSSSDQISSEADEEGDWEEVEVSVPGDSTAIVGEATAVKVARVRRKKRPVRTDAAELRLRGRRDMCKRIADIAPHMLKQSKLRLLTSYLDSKILPIGKEDDELTKFIIGEAPKLAERSRVLAALNTPGSGTDDLKAVIFAVLLQEETHSTPEYRLYEKVADFEREIVKRAKTLDLTDLRKSDPDWWHCIDTYRVLLEAAWGNDGLISPDEGRLLRVLRDHFGISMDDHWAVSALLKRFPKDKCVIHTPDEINEARKELQRQGLLWNYKNDADQNIDVIPAEIAAIICREHAGQELQAVNFRRLASHDAILASELRTALHRVGGDRAGNKAELIERVVASGVKPSGLLNPLDKEKLSAMCGGFGLKTSGAKAELIGRLIDFYDDLTFEARVTKDPREVWYANYELLAGRAYAELRAKKVITKDLDIEHQFEDATAFLFDNRLRMPCDMTRKDNKADGRLALDGGQTLLLDCKSAEGPVNLQDYLDGQFDGYLRKEQALGKNPIGFLVIAPAFTPQSLNLAYKYKARTNWDIALITAEGLRYLADRWAAAEPQKPFPVRLLNCTAIIDKERAEVLLSLA
ncbi:hypothetical protein [Zavarzinella formosa]|uniref:hypothetical protein n=1 Tax=Zavarzinella formosa TaxID=360055 RepID=UPI0003005B86|nr:hypothetical protein [Zavarzinella formosa]